MLDLVDLEGCVVVVVVYEEATGQLIFSDSHTTLSQRVASREVRKTCVIRLPNISLPLLVAFAKKKNNRSIRLLGKSHGYGEDELEWKIVDVD